MTPPHCHTTHLSHTPHTHLTLSHHTHISQGFSPPMLIFVQSKERAKDLFHELIYDGLNVDVIHSERTQAQRDNVVKAFRAGKVRSC